ncbi:MAG TPA: prolyl oligopeptidase family serine peptidase [Myxococcaceae bacterium]|nr:prolyl oligopeptidase family serine peptidase [Myxococcaceae bacterium]
MRLLLLTATATATLLACSSSREAKKSSEDVPVSATPAQPQSRSVDVVDEIHGVSVPDPYRWLEDEKDPEVQAWMNAQDAYTRDVLDDVAGREQITKRLEELAYVDSISIPSQRGGRLFYMRRFADKEKGVAYWREGEQGEEKVLLDPNTWSEDGSISLGMVVPSPDGKKVIFSRKPNAADESTLYVLDVDTGKESEIDVIPGAKYASPNWTPDGKAFVYEWLPTDPSIPVDERPGYTEIRLHTLGTDPATDTVLHEALGDPTRFLNATLSRDGKYLLATHMRGWGEMNVFWKRFGTKDAWRLLARGIYPEDQAERRATFAVVPWKDRFYVTTNDGAPNGRLFVVDPAKLGKASTAPDALEQERKRAWKELVPEQEDAKLEWANVVGGHLSLSYLKDVTSRVDVRKLDGTFVRTLELPTAGTASGLVGEPDQPVAFFSFTSFTIPTQVYRVDMREGKVSEWAKVELPIQPDAFEVRQVFYPSKDGTRIPMFLVHKKGLKADGNNPVWLYGYGGFDISLTPGFRASIMPWLEMGGIYAVANLRGGGEFGKAWHDAGRLANKQNVFDDFAAAAEYLIEEQLTRPERIVIHGGSNGGLLVGTAMTQRPELYGAVLCAVPLLDMVRYHLFGSGRTWIPEYGSPEREEDFKWIHAYSPYHHVKEGTEYPALLMLGADTDDRVDPMHARKFMAAIQNATASEAPVLFRLERNAGHGGADMIKQFVASTADQYAFVMEVFNLQPGPRLAADDAAGQAEAAD